MSGNTKCPVSGQELRMHKEKVQYTKHHLLRNIIRQQAAKAKVSSYSLTPKARQNDMLIRTLHILPATPHAGN